MTPLSCLGTACSVSDGLVPIGEALADLPGPVQAIREASPQALHHWPTR